MTKIVEEFELYGKQYRLETGELAKQATGAVLVTCGATSVLVTAVVSSQEKDYDFFPLTVDYIEKMYAVGRIPGGYLKREAKPSDHGTLVARMVDRPIRPGFPDGYKNEVHIVATPFVIDGENLPDTICVAGASAALLVGGAPFDGPAACVRIGRDVETGEFIVNPTFEESAHSDLELTIAGTADPVSSGFLGALLAGFVGGYFMLAFEKLCEKLPHSLEGIKPILLYPVVGVLFMGLFMCAFGPIVGALNTGLTSFLSSLGGTSKILLGAVLGGMMSIDMGGPFNKAAYVTGTGAIATAAAAGAASNDIAYQMMAAVMVGGMVPPIAIALATTFFKKKIGRAHV